MAVDRWMLTWGMALGTISWLILWSVNDFYAILFVGEDYLVEWLQFFCLFLAGIYFGLTVLKKVGVLRVFYILAALCSFFLAMEEISWGQRLFNIETPKALKAINAQNEINIHNLESLQRYRHWYLGGVGFLGLASTFITLSFFQPLKPKRFLRFAFTLTVISALVMEYGNSLFGRVPIEQAHGYRFYAGRFSELGELAFAMAILSYARHQKFFDEIKTH
jgi:hypothetical protein